MADWSAEQLARVDEATELTIATRRADGTLRAPRPIWVVRVGDQVYVRTWYRRTTGWYGRVLERPQAQVQVPGLTADVTVEDVGDGASTGSGDLRDNVDAAYRAKYGRYGGGSVDQMITDSAAATTLRLSPSS
jgi:hypothetical protein